MDGVFAEFCESTVRRTVGNCCTRRSKGVIAGMCQCNISYTEFIKHSYRRNRRPYLMQSTQSTTIPSTPTRVKAGTPLLRSWRRLFLLQRRFGRLLALLRTRAGIRFIPMKGEHHVEISRLDVLRHQFVRVCLVLRPIINQTH